VPAVALRLAVVSERSPGSLDAARQRRLTDEAPAPDRVEQLLFRDEPVGIADQLRSTSKTCGSMRITSPAERSS
jgi:hypothetical protein